MMMTKQRLANREVGELWNRRAANFNLLPRRMPSAEELANNFRARSATLRAGIKLAA